jgi:hypothetical protein
MINLRSFAQLVNRDHFGLTLTKPVAFTTGSCVYHHRRKCGTAAAPPMDEFGAPGTAGEKGLADHAAECLMTRTPSSLAFHLIHGLLILFICRVLCVKGMACPDRITVCCFDRFYSCDLGDRALTQSRTTGLRLNRCAARDGRTYYISTTTTDMHARRESCDLATLLFAVSPLSS